ncbi:hypothetical protein OAC41_01550 [Acidimicrobiales bacterium]|nr:hypothetical protein [Acidimicrobiales bacterium]
MRRDMQLAHAIDAWVDAHGRGLSVSTQRDIQRIRAAVIEVGWQGLPCDQVDREVREDIIEVATQTGTLGGSAISEFFNVVLQWAAIQLDTGPSADDDLGSSGAFGDESEPTGWEDLNDDDESDEPEPTGWEDLDDEPDDNQPDDDQSHDESDDDQTHHDDDEPDDDQSHDDDTKTDHEPEDWVGYLSTAQDGDGFTGLAPENETADEGVQEKAAASSFFKALGSSPPVDEDDEPVLVIENEAATKDATGIFSAAAEQVPQNRTSGIDWITVAYFAVAAICFALVIYFYLTSS